MALPHTMIPGDIARANEVNDNFAYIMSILGDISTPGRVITPTEFLLGARGNVLMTGAHDTGDTSKEFFQIGWNVDYNFVSGAWRAARFLNNRPGTMIRIGPSEFSVWATTNATNDLDAYLQKVFNVRATSSVKGHVYLPTHYSIQAVDAVAGNLGDYRLTTVLLTTPVTLYSATQFPQGATTHFFATSYGIPRDAKAVIISIAADNTGSDDHNRMWIFPKGQDTWKGIFIGIPARSFGNGYGFVPLGAVPHQYGFTMILDRSLLFLFMYIMGYLV